MPSPTSYSFHSKVTGGMVTTCHLLDFYHVLLEYEPNGSLDEFTNPPGVKKAPGSYLKIRCSTISKKRVGSSGSCVNVRALFLCLHGNTKQPILPIGDGHGQKDLMTLLYYMHT